MKHLTEIYGGEPFNFEMVYSRELRFFFLMCLIFIEMAQDKVWKQETRRAELLDLDVK